MGDEQEILAGNEAFYAAFNAQDVDSMALLWAEEAECVCLHPGAAAIHGRTAILRSWRAILGSRGAPRIDVESARVVVLGETAMVLCYERVGLFKLGGAGRHGWIWFAKSFFYRGGRDDTPRARFAGSA